MTVLVAVSEATRVLGLGLRLVAALDRDALECESADGPFHVTERRDGPT